ncbi:MAG TPA: hypothetical protein VF698_07335, partial [Thermoanaerobaculia bacterium]
MKRILYPALALILTVVTVVQVSAMRSTKAATTPVAAPKSTETRIVAEGRLAAYPGAEVTVGSDVAGTIEKLL